MRRLLLQLSAATWDEVDIDARQDDILIARPNLQELLDVSDYRPLRASPQREGREAANTLVELLQEIEVPLIRNIVRSYLNEFFLYAVAPAVALVEQVSDVLIEQGVDEVVVIAPILSGPLPNFGFRTSELNRGSDDLLYGRIASSLPGIFSDVRLTFIRRSPDLLARQWIRWPALRAASLLFQTIFTIKVAILGLFTRKSHSPTSTLIIHRAHSQSRFVKTLTKSADDIKLAIIGQLQSLDLFELHRLNRQYDDRIPRATVAVSKLCRAAMEARADRRAIGSWCRTHRAEASVAIGDYKLPIDLTALATEIALFPALLFYRRVLHQIIENIAPDRVVGFELVGRAAAFEAQAARGYGCSAHSIQVATITDRTHPIFPLADFFHADSPESATYLRNIGILGDGEVRYSGTPRALVNPLIKGKLQRIAFFSQPYEPKFSISIFEAICEWASQNDCKVRLRVHPRDMVSRYKLLLERYEATVTVDGAPDSSETVEWSQVVITRTSSVAKDALIQGRPPMLCLLSQFDREVSMDMIKPDLEPSCIVYDITEISERLSSQAYMIEAARALQDDIFTEQSNGDLAGAVLRQ